MSALQDMLVAMTERRDPDVTPTMGGVHAWVALCPGLPHDATPADDIDEAMLARYRRAAIANAKRLETGCDPGSLRASSARYALRLLAYDRMNDDPMHMVDIRKREGVVCGATGDAAWPQTRMVNEFREDPNACSACLVGWKR